MPALIKPLQEFTEQAKLKFWDKVDTRGPDDCWLWEGSLTDKGYGRVRIVGYENKRAHRIALFLHTGVDPFPLLTCHRCDIRYPVTSILYRRCCNPDHLFSGTNAENLADMVAKGRSAKGDRHGMRIHPEAILRGARNGRAKLTEAQVLDIRRLYAEGGTSHNKLAQLFGIQETTIGFILNRKSWAHAL